MRNYSVMLGLSLTLWVTNSSALFAQVPWYAPTLGRSYGGVYPGAYGGYGVGGFGTAQTPFSSAATGMGNLARGEGAYNVMTATAMRQEAQARSQALDNMEKAHDYHQKNVREREAINAQKKEKEQKEDQAARARAQEFNATHRTAPLSSAELNPSTGAITWPTALKSSDYSNHRKELEQLFQSMAKDGLTAGISDQVIAQVGEMKDALRRNIKDLPLPEYTESRKFLDRVAATVH